MDRNQLSTSFELSVGCPIYSLNLKFYWKYVIVEIFGSLVVIKHISISIKFLWNIFLFHDEDGLNGSVD